LPELGSEGENSPSSPGLVPCNGRRPETQCTSSETHSDTSKSVREVPATSQSYPLRSPSTCCQEEKIQHVGTRGCRRRCLLAGNWSVLSQLSSLTLINTGIERHIRVAPSLTLTNLKHLRINHEYHNSSSFDDLTDWALFLRDAKSLETLNLSLLEHHITEVVQSLRSDCLRMCLLRFDFVRGDALVELDSVMVLLTLIGYQSLAVLLVICRSSSVYNLKISMPPKVT
jgi:hypothetical protein